MNSEKSIEKNIIQVDEHSDYKKSQFIISSVYKSTLVENRVLAVALSRIENAYEDREGSIIVELDSTALKKEFNLKGRSIYENLEMASRKLVGGRTIGFSDPENDRFEYVPLLTKASYENGKFILRFAPEMKKYLKDLKGNFTILNLETMLSFESVYSFRLYEILKSKAYAPKGKSVTDETKFLIEMSVSELKLELGVVNAEMAKVKAILLETKNGVPDYDKAVEKAEEKMYNRYSKFKSDCIDKAIKEINEKTEMFVECEPVRTGRGGKTTSLKFYVSFPKKGASEIEDIVDEKPMDEDDFIDALREVLSEKLKTSELRTIAKAAEYKMDVVVQADRYVQKHEYKEYAAYMVSCIQKKWYETDNIIDKTKKKKPSRAVVDVQDHEIKPLLSKDDIKNKMIAN